jgi:hypothetical protein
MKRVASQDSKTRYVPRHSPRCLDALHRASARSNDQPDLGARFALRIRNSYDKARLALTVGWCRLSCIPLGFLLPIPYVTDTASIDLFVSSFVSTGPSKKYPVRVHRQLDRGVPPGVPTLLMIL